MNLILRKIVVEGTAKLANVDGYEVGGKTGTANKSTKGGYSKKHNKTANDIGDFDNSLEDFYTKL